MSNGLHDLIAYALHRGLGEEDAIAITGLARKDVEKRILPLARRWRSAVRSGGMVRVPCVVTADELHSASAAPLAWANVLDVGDMRRAGIGYGPSAQLARDSIARAESRVRELNLDP